MSTNSGDNWDLIGEIPGYKPAGPISNLPGHEDVNDNEKLMARIRKFYDDGTGAFEENRRMHSEDLNFIYNAEAQGQWDPVVLQNRRGKPCYTFNRCIGPVNIVTADMRQTRPSGKVRPVSDEASEAVAEIYAGLCRSIEQESRADAIYKEQYKYAVAGGYGAWRVMPTYMTDDGPGAFDQVLRVINIANPQTVVWDPECADACAGDANKCVVAERIAKDVYKSLYKDEGNSFQMSRDAYGWYVDDEIRIAEYFERVPMEKWIAQMTDGSVVDYNQEVKDVEKTFDAAGVTAETHGVVRVATDKQGNKRVRRTVKWKVLWVKCDGTNILEGPLVYDWKRIPVIRCPGRYINIEGRKKFQSLVRHAKDAQRSYNSRASDMIERSALLPKAPYLVTQKMVKGYENEWNQANVASRPYLPYNIDEKAPEGGMPFRVPPLDLPQGAVALAQMAIQDIQSTIGAYDASLGNADEMNRVSGSALVQHNKRSDMGSYEFVDGYEAALQLTWEIFVDMIKTVYDSSRIERIIGKDGIEKLVQLNHAQEGSDDILNDITAGEYNVTVTVGPNYQTARQESLATMIDAAEAMPQIAQFCPDLLTKNLDSPDAHEMSRRLRIPLIWQGIIKPTQDETDSGAIPPKPQDPTKQLETQVLQGKARDIAARATIAESRAKASGLENEHLQYKTAGAHLGNLKMAKELGSMDAAAQAEQQAAQLEQQQNQQQGQQDLQQSQAEGQQSLQQQAGEHAMTMTADAHTHAATLQRGDQLHARAIARAEELHKQKVKHTDEMHTKKLAQAKALAAAKPKKAKKAA